MQIKVKVRDIPVPGLGIKTQMTAEELGLTEDGIKYLTPLNLDIHVERAGDELIVDGKAEGRYEFSCARCLTAVVRERRDEFQIFVDIDPETEIVDVGEEVRQEMVIRLSPIILCREDCQGICPRCGANLNEGLCRCRG